MIKDCSTCQNRQDKPEEWCMENCILYPTKAEKDCYIPDRVAREDNEVNFYND